MQEAIKLGDLRVDEFVNLTDTLGSNYVFLVMEEGERPICEFAQQDAGDPRATGPVRVCLEGCADPDGLEEDESEGLPPGDGTLRVGGLVTIFDRRPNPPREPTRYRFPYAVFEMSVRKRQA